MITVSNMFFQQVYEFSIVPSFRFFGEAGRGQVLPCSPRRNAEKITLDAASWKSLYFRRMDPPTLSGRRFFSENCIAPKFYSEETKMKKGCLFALPLLVALWSVAVAQNDLTGTPQKPEPKSEIPSVVADVGGEKILDKELAEECLRQHGVEELKDIVKKYLIMTECNRLKIRITQEEINDEVTRMAQSFGFTTEEWLDLLERERGITKDQYMADILWPILAIRKIAGPKLNVTEAEIQKEVDARYGPAVQVRQIVLSSRARAEQVLAEVQANPEAFASIAKNRSEDPASAPFGGMLQPIRRHTVHPSIEQIVFALQPGQVSPIVEWPVGQFIIYHCEQHLAPQNVDLAKIRDVIIVKIRDAKIRVVAEEVFTDLQNRANIDIIFSDPAKSAQYPDIAAVVNGQTISREYLASRCLRQHGKAVLSDMISKKIIEIDCRRKGITLTDADLDAEIVEMAIRHVPLKADGQPNVALWIEIATQNYKTPFGVYRSNTVWPMLALKRLTRHLVHVPEEDIQKSFEANFGPKVRCLAIVLDIKEQRRALEVWELANRNRTEANFGNLSRKYSADAEIRNSGGVIPAIGKHSRHAKLEAEAFSLQPGEISQIVQVDDSFMILYCLGIEQPRITDINEVRAELVADLFEKIERLVIAQYYQELEMQTAVDNYLTGESRNPEVERAMHKETIQR